MTQAIQKKEQKDLKIIAALRKDARMPLTQMSRQTRIPVSTLFDRIKTNTMITRHTSLVDFYKLGYATRANILIKVDKKDKQRLGEYLEKDFNVNSVFRINNGFDFMVEGIFREIKDEEAFIERLESKFEVMEIKSYFIIEDVKREGFLSAPELV